MIVSLTTFLLGKKSLAQRGMLPAKSLLNTLTGLRQFNRLFMAGLLLTGIVCFFALTIPKQANYIMLVAALCIVAYLIKVTWKLEKKPRNNMLVCILLTLISIGFWAIYMQCFSSFMLFADRNVNLHLFGLPISAEFTQTYNSIFIIALSPLFGLLWPWLGRKKLNPSYPTKFALGTLFMALGLLQLAFCVKHFNHSGLTSNNWLILSYCLQTIGELLLSPVGLAMITALSPPKYVGMMMGIWFLAIAAANAMGGMLATISDVPVHSSLLQSQAIYVHAFFDYGWIALGVAAIAFLLVVPLKKLVTQH